MKKREGAAVAVETGKREIVQDLGFFFVIKSLGETTSFCSRELVVCDLEQNDIVSCCDVVFWKKYELNIHA